MKKMLICSLLCIFISSSNFYSSLASTNECNEKIDCTLEYNKDFVKIIDDLSYKNSLWEKSCDILGAKSKNEAVNIWATGFKEKNSAILYLISTDELRIKIKNLLKNNLSWIISNNDSIIQDFQIYKEKSGKNLYKYKLIYNSIKNNTSNQKLYQTIVIRKENDLYKVCEFSDIHIIH